MKYLLYLKLLIVVLILVFYGSVLFHKIDLPTDDLGRHLTNGKIIWETKSIPETNFYSYTEPDFPFLNHHWLSGVVFYFLYSFTGFTGLIIFKILLLLAAFFLIFYVAAGKGNFWAAALASIPAIFILSERTDVRPEIFSYFFTALFLYFLIKFSDNPKTDKIFWLIPLQVIWANLHIYFFIGPAMTACFLLEKVIANRKNLKNNLLVKKLTTLFLLLSAGCFLNPAGYRIVFYPLNIFKNYGYDIVENKSPFFLEDLMHNPTIPFFKLALGFLIINFIIAVVFRNFSVFYFLAALATSAASIIAIRNFPFFSLIFIQVVSINLKPVLENPFKNIKSSFRLELITSIILIILLLISIVHGFQGKLSPDKEKGLGLAFQSNNAAEFFKKENLKGPVFNNYDIGSYLIWHLYPQEKVFVDNRPEAYSASFFTQIYIPMQTYEEKWQEQLKKYDFNAIFFTQQEGTWWGQNFLRQRLADKNWSLIYADSQAIILIKNNEANKELIEKHEITEKNIIDKIIYLKNEKVKMQLNGIHLLNLISRPDLAFNWLQELSIKYPEEARIWLEMGYIKSAEINADALIDASKYLEKAIELGENLPASSNQLGLVYFNLGQYEQAKNAWQKALNINPADENAGNYLRQLQQISLPKIP
jgi:tetratricopeptide (TPR) repeat protein